MYNPYMRRLLFLLSLAVGLFAQQTGTISGTIADPDGRPVRVPIRVVNNATKAAYQGMPSATGEYSIAPLPAGTYQLTVQALANSFRAFVRDGLTVSSGQATKLEIRLQEGIALNTLGDGREFFQDVAKANSAKQVIPKGATPRMPDGKPDFSGYWVAPGGAFDPGVPELQDWAETVATKRQADDLRDIPGSRCLPTGVVLPVNNGQPRRMVHIASLLVSYSEGQLPRQMFLDGRPHPSDPNPNWYGHSIGRWEGETLVVDTVGLNDKSWLDWYARPQTEKMHIIERFRRPDLGHLELEMTVDDAGALKKPWVIKRTYVLEPTDDIMENVCAENERDVQHLPNK